MKVLARPTTTPPAIKKPAKQKVLVLREPPKSVRPQDEPDRLPIRLAIGVIATLGGVGALWLLGVIGYRLGYAPLVRVPELIGDAGGGLATAALVLIGLPGLIIEAGLASPTALMIMFLVIALPAAGLSAARPLQRGGPAPSTLATAGGITGAIGGGLAVIGVFWWAAAPQRLAMLRPLPDDPAAAAQWITDLQTVAGLDAMVVAAAVLWAILMMRLPVQTWLRVLTVVATLFGVVVATVVMSVSNAAVAQITTTHSVGILEPGSGQRALVLGSTREHVAVLRVEENVAVVELRDRPVGFNVVERKSIGEFLTPVEEEGS